MRTNRHMAMMLAATMCASGALSGALIDTPAEPLQPIKPKTPSLERLSKAEKKRARKAAQRIKIGSSNV